MFNFFDFSRTRYIPWVLNLIFIFLGLNLKAEKFVNSYISFDLPSNWKCRMEGTESVCFNKFNKNAKEAIIILTAKEAGPNDNLNYFYTFLKTPRSLPDRNKMPMMSKVIHVKNRRITNHEWVDALHMSSEVESFYTRYLATVKDQLAILVTFSAHKKFYTKYSMEFLNAIKSLKVVATGKILAQRNQNKHVAAPRGANINFLNPNVGESEFVVPEKKEMNMKTKIIALILILAAAILFLMARQKKPNHQSAKKRRRK